MKDKSIEESILDFPQEDLCQAIWQKTQDGIYELTPEASSTIGQIAQWAQETFKIPEMQVRITGSIASNSYSSGSDVDIHFSSPKLKAEKADEFNKLLRSKFEELVTQNPQLAEIGGHKTEVYMQKNPFQDMMSVGCYDYIGKRWLAGPELKDASFDPYAEYFTKDMKNIDDVINDVRSVILQIYELSIAFIKTNDAKLKEQLAKKLKPLMSKAAQIFNSIRAKRAHKSSPKSKEDALEARDDKDWKIADSSFKLLDKFGYLGILRACTQNLDKFDKDISDIEMALKEIVKIIGDKISAQALNDSEKMFAQALQEVESIDESMPSLVKMSFIAGLMSIASLLPAAQLSKTLKDAKQQASQTGKAFTVDSELAKDAISKASKSTKMIGPMSETNVVNAVAQVLWKEARGESEGKAGREAVASVILNRTGNKPECIVDVLKQRHAFSCLDNYKGGWTDSSYRWFLPFKDIASNARNRAIWDECNQIALDLVQKKLKSTIGNRNAYLNKSTASADAVNTWGKSCDLKVGSHHFGYLKAHDPKYVVPGTFVSWKKHNAKQNANQKIVVVKAGQTLSKIAKDNKTTLAKILELNKDIKNPNAISVGQKVRIG